MENYALIARQERQIEALKTENDYLKKVKNPTQIENANLRERNDALELENQSLQSEIQVMTEKHNLRIEELESDLGIAERNVESAKARNFELIRQHHRKGKVNLLKMAFISVVAILCASVMTYVVTSHNALNDLQESHDKKLNENRDNIQLGKVINYLVEHGNSGKIIYPTTVSSYTGVDYNDVLLILLKLEELGVVNRPQFPEVGKQSQFQLK